MKRKMKVGIYLNPEMEYFLCNCGQDLDTSAGLIRHVKNEHPDRRPPTMKQIQKARASLLKNNGVLIG